MAKGRFVSYLRVSTAQQGRSGLGLEAQRRAVLDYLNGGRWRLIEEHVEVESGRRNDRPALARALAACRLHGATLLVAKIDRLSRNAAFLLALRDAGTEVTFADMPEANKLTVTVMAAVAEHEAEAIGARTKAALAAAKARGVKLGTPGNLTVAGARRGRRAGAETRRSRALQRAVDLAPAIRELQAAGARSLRQLAAGLNDRGVPATRGGQWSAAQVQRVLQLMEA